MLDLMEKALEPLKADFIEIRIEEVETTTIEYVRKDLESIGWSADVGGNVRGLLNGGWGFTSFNTITKIADLTEHVSKALKQAKVVAGLKEEKTMLAEAQQVRKNVKTKVRIDPRSVLLEDKDHLVREYIDILLDHNTLKTSRIVYSDVYKKKYYMNTEGSSIVQELTNVLLWPSAVAKRGDNVQRYSHMMVGLDYTTIENAGATVRQVAERATSLLDAKPAKSGRYRIVMDPILSGGFIHETLGHMSEADVICREKNLENKLNLGRKVGPANLTIVDNGTLKEAGHQMFDDEGVPSKKNLLMNKGVLSGRLHSRETAARLGEDLTGNARAVNYRFPPIVRMTNTYIKPKDLKLDEMIEVIKNGIYAKGIRGGTCDYSNFTFSPQEAFLIKNGKIDELIRDLTISGNVFDALRNIDGIGEDLTLYGSACGKEGQNPLFVSAGGPHIRIKDLIVGGR